MDAPAWIRAHLQPEERVAWTQPPAPGAMWGVVGPLVGAGFALVYAGAAVIDMPGPWTWLVEPMRIEERIGIPEWILAIVGAIGFVSLVARHAVVENLTTWVVTDTRLVRVVRFAPMATRSWRLHEVDVKRVRLKKKGATVSLRVPHRWMRSETFAFRARENAARCLAALREGGAGTPRPADEPT